MKRPISHTEISTAYDCQAKHAFSYTGHLTDGKVLKPHAPHARLRAGRAWGRGVAAFHQADASLTLQQRYQTGLNALNASLDEDAAQTRAHDQDNGDTGQAFLAVYDETEHHETALKLADTLWHYAQTTEPLTITDPEFELRLPIPSRTGRGVSNRYEFHAFLDGLAVEDGRLWIVEYKLRDQLTDFEQVARGRQYRRYVWSSERFLELQLPIAGIIVDERVSDAPKPARWVNARRKGEGIDGKVPSHAKDQLTTSALYVAACQEADVDPDPETVATLDARRWQARHRVIFRRSEIEEAGRELVSAAQYIGQLDSGALFPVRNPAPWRCRGCAFRDVCSTPDDRELVEANFDLREPKRLREQLLEGSTS